MSAGAALIDMPAERGGPTPGQGAEDCPLLHAEPRMLVEKVLTLRVEDIGHATAGRLTVGSASASDGTAAPPGAASRAAARADSAPRGDEP